MPTALLVVQLSEPSPEGHGYYRVAGTSREMAAADGVTVVDCPPQHRWAGWLADHADVLALHTFDPEWASRAAARRAAGRVTVLDASDDFCDVQPWTKFSAGWLDRTRQDQFFYTAAAADAVQTSTDALAAVWRPVARKVIVAPNPRPPWGPPPPAPTRPLTAGWAGSATHLPDWFRLAPVLERWTRDRTGARLAVMTDDLARDWVSLPSNQYAFRPTGTLAEYRRFLGEVDIGVVPLLDTRFNRGRTALKWAEFAAAGVVGVFEAVGPYPAAVADGRTGFLYRTADELSAVLDRLAADSDLRRRVRAAAWDELSNQPAGAAAAGRLSAYRDLLGGDGRGVSLPDRLRADAEAVGRHLTLTAGAPEEAVRVAAASADPSAVARLGDLRQTYPGYTAADRSLVRTLTRVGRGAEAAALVGGPAATSPGLLADLAAADPTGARPLLERAVGLSPADAELWTALLTVAGPDGGRAGRAAANQPRNYLAALTAVRELPAVDRSRGLADWLDRFPPTAHPEELPYMAAAFAAVIEAEEARAALLPVLRVATARFPDSAKVHDLLGRAEYTAGHADAAGRAFARSAAVARTARGYQAEYPDPPAAARRWLVADYLRTAPDPTREVAGA